MFIERLQFSLLSHDGLFLVKIVEWVHGSTHLSFVEQFMEQPFSSFVLHTHLALGLSLCPKQQSYCWGQNSLSLISSPYFNANEQFYQK